MTLLSTAAMLRGGDGDGLRSIGNTDLMSDRPAVLDEDRASEASARSAPPADERSVANAINQRIFETSQDLILVVDRRGTLLRVSPSCNLILGYAPEEMVGRSARDFLYPDDLEGTRTEMRLGRRGRVMRHFECRYVHRDGHAVPLT